MTINIFLLNNHFQTKRVKVRKSNSQKILSLKPTQPKLTFSLNVQMSLVNEGIPSDTFRKFDCPSNTVDHMT